MMLCAAHAADAAEDRAGGATLRREEDLYMVAVHFLELLTLATPCDPCSEFYAFMVSMHDADLRAGAHRRGLVRLVFKMRAIVDGKIQGSLGAASGAASEALVVKSSAAQLQKRLDITRTLLVGHQVFEQFMLRCARLGVLKQGDGSTGGRHIALADVQLSIQSLCFACLAYAQLARSLGQASLAHYLERASRRAIRAGNYDWKVAYTALHDGARSLEDGLTETMEETLARHMRACSTLADWSRNHK